MQGIKRLERKEYPKDYESKSIHSHNECEVCYVDSGKRVIQLEDEIITLEAGSLLFINRQIAHKTLSQTNEPHECFILRYHSGIAAKWQYIVPDVDFSRLYARSFMLLKPSMMDQVFIQGMIKTLLTSYQRNMQGVFNLKLMEILVYLFLKSQKIAQSDVVMEKRRPKKNHYHELVEYIVEKDYNVTLEDLSRQFFLSRYYICHLFKMESGATLNDFINGSKIRNAVKLLEATEMSVTAIVDKCGYNSIGSFGRVFKKHMGISPSEYRRRHRCHIEYSDQGKAR